MGISLLFIVFMSHSVLTKNEKIWLLKFFFHEMSIIVVGVVTIIIYFITAIMIRPIITDRLK